MEVKRKSEVENVFLVDNSFWSMSAEEQSEILDYIVNESKIQEEMSPFIEFKIGDREYTFYPKEDKILMKLEKDKENKRYMHILISKDEQVAKMNVIANYNYTINKKYDPTPSIKREYNKENKPMYVIDNIAESGAGAIHVADHLGPLYIGEDVYIPYGGEDGLNDMEKMID